MAHLLSIATPAEHVRTVLRTHCNSVLFAQQRIANLAFAEIVGIEALEVALLE